MTGVSETICKSQIGWLERYLRQSKEHAEKLRDSWHRIYGGFSKESEGVIKSLREKYGFRVVSFNDRGLLGFPYVEIRVNGPDEYHLEFDGLKQIKRYFSILDKFLTS